VDDETGRHIVQEMRRLVDSAPSIRDRIAAARVVIAAAAVHVRREATAVQERGQDMQASQAALRRPGHARGPAAARPDVRPALPAGRRRRHPRPRAGAATDGGGSAGGV